MSKLMQYFIWILAGFLLMGAVLDAFLNSLTLITLPISIIGTVVVILGLVSLHYFLIRQPQTIQNESGQTIQRNGIMIKEFFGGLGIIFILWFPHFFGASHPDLYILSTGNRENSYFIGGDDIDKFGVGDRLVVYDVLIRDAEQRIGLLQITATLPNTLEAVALLIDTSFPIRPNLRLDDQIEMISTAELTPANESAIGFILEEPTIYLLPGHDVQVSSELEALALTSGEGGGIDYLSFPEQVILEVESIGLQNSLARVRLKSGRWPETGTILVLVTVAPPPEPTIEPTGAVQCRVKSFEHLPVSPVNRGTDVALAGEGECNGGVRAVRFMIDGQSKAETSLPRQTEFWRTNEYLPGTHTLCFEVAGGADASWEKAARACVTYELKE
jgi:hypothetical protein